MDGEREMMKIVEAPCGEFSLFLFDESVAKSRDIKGLIEVGIRTLMMMQSQGAKNENQS